MRTGPSPAVESFAASVSCSGGLVVVGGTVLEVEGVDVVVEVMGTVVSAASPGSVEPLHPATSRATATRQANEPVSRWAAWCPRPRRAHPIVGCACRSAAMVTPS